MSHTPIPANRARLTVWAAAAATGGTIVRARDGAGPAIGVRSDSREIASGNAFVALKGERFDGHDHLAAAIDAGATLVVVERGRAPADTRADVVEVDDTLVAWGDLARAHLRAWRRARRGDACVVAITGSAGKTTTKELCATLLRAMDRTHATVGNLNNRVGVPAVVFGLEPEHRFCVLEIGMNVRGEIAELARIAEPDVGVITNVGVAHAEGVGGSRADVAREKGALFEALGRRGVAIANADDEAVLGELARSRARTVETFGQAEGARYRLLQRQPLGARGAGLTVRAPGGVFQIELPLVGDAQAIDFLAALAAAEAATGAAIEVESLRAVLSRYAAVAGRSAVRCLRDDVIVIDDSYNANPASMRAALSALREVALDRGARMVAVLGEMKELGPFAEGEHDALGDAVAESGVALVIGCGGLVDRALDRAAAAGVATRKCEDNTSAARAALEEVKAGDVVLVKGSRGARTERVVDALVARYQGERA